MKYREFFANRCNVYLSAGIVSLLLSIWAAFKSAVINPDAICYVISAESLKTQSLTSVMHLCAQAQWPFYSYLIYLVSTLTSLSYVASAYTLNSVFSLISVLCFIKIVEYLGGTVRALWFAALIILLSHEFTNVREYIIRDHGFWAFYLASILALLHFLRVPRLPYAIAWIASCVIATLFRIEGAVFFVLIPFVTFFNRQFPWQARFKQFLLLNSALLLGAIAVGTWMLSHNMFTVTETGRVQELFQQVHSGVMVIAEQYHVTRAALASYVLTADAVVHVDMILCALFIGWYLISIIMNVSWIYAALLLYGWLSRATKFIGSDRLVLISYLLVNIIITFSFLLERLFLSKRYLIALSLVLMLWVPFILNTLTERAKYSTRGLVVLIAIWLCIIASAIGGIFEFGYSKAYIRNAGAWLATNVPATASIYSNDLQVLYYSNHFKTNLFSLPRSFTQLDTIQHTNWQKYDYIALRLGNKLDTATDSLLKNIHLLPAQVYTNARGDRVVIYQVKS